MIVASLSLLSTANAQDAEVRVLHLSPDAPNVDVFVNDGVPAAIMDLPFTLGTGYIPLPADTYNFKVSPVGTTPADAVIDIDLTLDAGVKYSAVAIDQVASITPIALVDDDGGIAAGDIRLQITHAAVGVGAVDLFAGQLGQFASGVNFGDTLVVDIPAGPRTVRLDADQDGAPDFRFDVPDLGAGILVNVFAATDSAGDVFLLAWLPDGSTARVDGVPAGTSGLRVIHLSPDAPAVDLYVRGGLVVEALSFEESAGYVDFGSGPANVSLFATGTTVSPVFDRTPLLRKDTDYTVVAYGAVANLQVKELVDGSCGAGAGYYCLQAFHAADGVGDVNLINESTGKGIAKGFAYGTSARVKQAAGAFTLGLDIDNDFVSDFTFDVPNVGSGVLVDVFAALDATGAPFLRALLEDGTSVRIDAN